MYLQDAVHMLCASDLQHLARCPRRTLLEHREVRDDGSVVLSWWPV